jgi:hypothetical protein
MDEAIYCADSKQGCIAAASANDWQVMIEHVTGSPDIVSGLLNLNDAR